MWAGMSLVDILGIVGGIKNPILLKKILQNPRYSKMYSEFFSGKDLLRTNEKYKLLYTVLDSMSLWGRNMRRPFLPQRAIGTATSPLSTTVSLVGITNSCAHLTAIHHYHPSDEDINNLFSHW